MLAADDDCCAFIESGEDLHAGRKAFPDLHPASFRVAFLDEGRLLEQGPPDRIFDTPREERTRAFLSKVL